MNDLISRQAAIEALYDWSEHSMTDAEAWHIKQVIGDIKSLPSAQPELSDEESELIYRIGYEKGKLDGVKYCTERLKKMNDSFCGADMRGGQDIPEEE